MHKEEELPETRFLVRDGMDSEKAYFAALCPTIYNAMDRWHVLMTRGIRRDFSIWPVGMTEAPFNDLPATPTIIEEVEEQVLETAGCV